MTAHALLGLFACVCGWLATWKVMRHSNFMFQAFVGSKFGRTLIALAAGGFAQAAAALVMGHADTARVVVASTIGGLGAAVALHFKSQDDNDGAK